MISRTVATATSNAALLASPPPQPTLQDLKKQYRTDDEDELILRITVPEADLARMRAAGPIKTSYPLLSTPELEQVRKLLKMTDLPVIDIKSRGLSVSLRRKRAKS